MSDLNANVVEQTLSAWKKSLVKELLVGELLARNSVAHKWKATFRSLELREAVLWRLQDLLAQSYVLYQHEHVLGARILLRSGFETLATLIHLNQLMAKVIDGSLHFHDFSKKNIYSSIWIKK